MGNGTHTSETLVPGFESPCATLSVTYSEPYFLYLRSTLTIEVISVLLNTTGFLSFPTLKIFPAFLLKVTSLIPLGREALRGFFKNGCS